jgi:tRNA modification GTPase
MDTIYALSSAPGKAGVAVVRVSGPASRDCIEHLTDRLAPRPRQAALRDLALEGAPIDKALVLYFPAPASFTGEDMAEFHVHGGRAVVAALSQALETLGLRRAEAGEFTKRAYLNGKLDLTGAEAIADLIEAETAAQQAQALAQAGGSLSRLYEGWTQRLTRDLAHVEATLDFGDEDLPPDMLAAVAADVQALAREIAAHLGEAVRGERLRGGIRIAILGAPNAGKSSLLNYLAGRDIAIVSQRAGTTRDVLEAHLDLGGYPVILADTAGLRETEDEIEAEGIARARAWAKDADLRLLLVEAGKDEALALIGGEGWVRGQADIVVKTKADLAGGTDGISVRTGQGIPALLDTLTRRVSGLIGDVARPAPTRERHRQGLSTALEAVQAFDDTQAPDLAAETLRIALTALGRITGRVDAEALLDVIFRDFCIGK